MPAIFISYRRSDAGGYAGRIFDRLRQQFGDGEVFRDVDTIDSGTRFPDAIARQLEDCRVFVVIIGPTWIKAADENAMRRLDDPRDWVRIEIATALKRNVCIIPVTVGGAAMPAAHDLPEDLRSLVDWQRRDLRDGDTWTSDLEFLLQRIAKELGFRSTQFKRKAAVVLASIALLGLIGAASLLYLYRSIPGSTQGSPAAIVIFDNTNTVDVHNQPSQLTYFTITKPHFVTKIYTYHWNCGRGSPPGLLSLRRSDGTVFGQWESQGIPGHNPKNNKIVENASWLVEPKISLPAGKYQVVDSKPETWSHNDQSKGEGFVFIQGHPEGFIRSLLLTLMY
jgi:hypothetical protein